MPIRLACAKLASDVRSFQPIRRTCIGGRARPGWSVKAGGGMDLALHRAIIRATACAAWCFAQNALLLMGAAVLLPALAVAQAAAPGQLPADLEALPRAERINGIATEIRPGVRALRGGDMLVLHATGASGGTLQALNLQIGGVLWAGETAADQCVIANELLWCSGAGQASARVLRTGKIQWRSAPERLAALWGDRLWTCAATTAGAQCELQELEKRKALWRGILPLNEAELAVWLTAHATADQRIALTDGPGPAMAVDRAGKVSARGAVPMQQSLGQWYSGPSALLHVSESGTASKLPLANWTGACYRAGDQLALLGDDGVTVRDLPALPLPERSKTPKQEDSDSAGELANWSGCAPAYLGPDGRHWIVHRLAGTAVLWRIRPGQTPESTLLADFYDPSGADRASSDWRPVPAVVSAAGDVVVLHNGSTQVVLYRLGASISPPRRQKVPLTADVSQWLDMVGGRIPRTLGGECVDVPFSAETSSRRLLRLPAAAWRAELVARLGDANGDELAAWAAFACGLAGPEEALAWSKRWRELLADRPATDLPEHVRRAALCPQGLGDAAWRGPMFARMAKQPWNKAWLAARYQLLTILRDPPSDAEASAWAGDLAAGVLGALARQRERGTDLSWGKLWQVSQRWLGGWRGWAAFLADFDLRLRALGPAEVCLRGHSSSRYRREFTMGGCVREPPDDAWQAPSGWAVVVDGVGLTPEANEVWAFRWDGGRWQGPWFVGFGPILQPEHELKGWRLGDKWHLHDNGTYLSWRFEGDATKCDPDELKMRTAARPPAAAWSDIATDSDGDGWTDRLEAALGTDPGKADSDGDGTADARDPAPLCPRSNAPVTNEGSAAIAAALRRSSRQFPLRWAPDVGCVDAASAGGPLLPPSASGLVEMTVLAPSRSANALRQQGPWTVIEGAGERQLGAVQVQTIREGNGWFAVVEE